MLQLNGFLFAALALIGSEMDDRLERLLLHVLPATGIAVSTAGLCGVVAANIAIIELKKRWSQQSDKRWPRPFGDTFAFWLGLASSVLPPLALVVTWCYLLWRL